MGWVGGHADGWAGGWLWVWVCDWTGRLVRSHRPEPPAAGGVVECVCAQSCAPLTWSNAVINTHTHTHAHTHTHVHTYTQAWRWSSAAPGSSRCRWVRAREGGSEGGRGYVPEPNVIVPAIMIRGAASCVWGYSRKASSNLMCLNERVSSLPEGRPRVFGVTQERQAEERVLVTRVCTCACDCAAGNVRALEWARSLSVGNGVSLFHHLHDRRVPTHSAQCTDYNTMYTTTQIFRLCALSNTNENTKQIASHCITGPHRGGSLPGAIQAVAGACVCVCVCVCVC
mgnify:CR=1 FL=1